MPPPLSLADIILAINARLPADVIKRFGAEFLDEKTGTPRVVWVPERDTFQPASKGGSPGGGLSLGGPRSIQTRVQQVAVHIRATGTEADADEYKHLRALDALVTRVLYAIHDVAKSSITIDSGEHVSVQVTGFARTYVLRVSFWTPVIRHPEDETTTTALISSVDQLGIMGESEGRPAP